MELAIVIIVLGVVIWWFIFRDKKAVQEALEPAPYKVETVQEVAPVAIAEPVVEPVAATVAEEAPVKKAATKKPVAKKAATTKKSKAKTAK